MLVFVLSLAVMLLSILGLAVGVLFGRKPLAGSCGGNAVVSACPTCRRGEPR